MTKWDRWAFNLLYLVVALTGFAYLYMKYFIDTDDPFAIVNHPMQSTALSVHVVAAPIFIGFFGILFRSHVLPSSRLSRLPNRKSGWISMVTYALMAVSAYLIQGVSEPALIAAFTWTHIVASVCFVVCYSVHFFLGRRINSLPLRERRLALRGRIARDP